MTKKDFELIAYVVFTANIRQQLELPDIKDREEETRAKFAVWFADKLAEKNPRFDRQRFLIACGVCLRCSEVVDGWEKTPACTGSHYKD